MAGCAYYSPDQEASDRQVAAKQLESGANSDARVDAAHGQTAAQRGDWSASADFSARSFKQSPNLTTEFNLATAYQNTGRIDLAVPLYIDLAERGQYLETVRVPDAQGHWPAHEMAANYAEEARARLVKLGVNPELLPQPAGGDAGMASIDGNGTERPWTAPLQ